METEEDELFLLRDFLFLDFFFLEDLPDLDLDWSPPVLTLFRRLAIVVANTSEGRGSPSLGLKELLCWDWILLALETGSFWRMLRIVERISFVWRSSSQSSEEIVWHEED